MTSPGWTNLEALRLGTPGAHAPSVFGNDGHWAVSTLADGVWRLHLHVTGTPAAAVSHAVVRQRVGATSPDLLTLDATGLSVAGPGQSLITVLNDGTRWSGTRREIKLTYPAHESTYGLGEKTGGLDKRGDVLEFWNTDSFLYDRTSDPLYKSIPFWIGLRDGQAYGVLVDNPGRVKIDFGAWEADEIRIRVETGDLDLYVIPGPSPVDVLKRYTALTGRPTMPPRWALGFHQCRYSYRPDTRVRDVARKFREQEIPCDAIWLDIHYMHGFRCFTWDPVGFADPKGLIDDLHEDGFRVVTMIDPGLKVEPEYHIYASGRDHDVFVKTPEGNEGHGICWPGPSAYPDFFKDDVRAWWGPLYADLLGVGVDGFWNDMNEPSVFDGINGTFPDDIVHERPGGALSHGEVHNAYGHEMVRGTFDGLAALRPDRRPFVLTRAAYAGTQRYAAAWSGDNLSSWDDLRLSVPMAMNMAASGFPLYGPDIGGFAGTPSPELFVRWLQAAAYMGLMRVHTCLGTPDQEPWSFGEPWTGLARDAIRGRYRLIAYLYSLFHEAAASGAPVVQPLWMRWPEAPELRNRDDCWMLGADLIVAPILEPGVTRRMIALPPGRWYSFPDGQPLRVDGCDATVDAPLDAPPLLARGGAIVPWQDPAHHTAAQDADVLRVKVFAGDDGAFTLVEDDGDGPAAGGGPIRATTIKLKSEPLHQVVTVSAPEGAHAGVVRAIDLELHGLPGPPDQVFRDGEPETARIDPAGIDDPGGWSWDDVARSVRLLIPLGDADTTIEISHPPLPLPSTRPTLIARRVENQDVPWPSGGGLHLNSARHKAGSSWWRARDLDVRVAARWTPEALQIRCTVHDPDRVPSANDQEDGLQLILEVAQGVFQLRVAPDGPDSGAWLREDLYWAPHKDVAVLVHEDGPLTTYGFEVPARVLGAPVLEPGLECPCDILVQHSSSDGSRGVVEWVRGHTDPTSPGGRLRLL